MQKKIDELTKEIKENNVLQQEAINQILDLNKKISDNSPDFIKLEE